MSQHEVNQGGSPVPTGGDDVYRLRAARDAALQAAQAAIRDTTRLTRLLTILSDPAPLDLLLDRALAALSELFAADIVMLLDPIGTGDFSPLAAIGLPEDMIHRPMVLAGWHSLPRYDSRLDRERRRTIRWYKLWHAAGNPCFVNPFRVKIWNWKARSVPLSKKSPIC